MMEISFINQIFVLLINIIGFWLAFWVLLKNRKAKSNQTFFIMTVFILLWITFGFFFSASNQSNWALFWLRLNFGAVSLFFIAAYFFSIFFPREEKKYPIFNKIVLSLGILLFFISIFTNLIIKNIEIKDWGNDIIMGKGGSFFYIIVIFLTFLILFNLFKKYFKLSKQEKLKVQYFLIGISIFALMNIIFNVIFPIWKGTLKYSYFGDYSAIFPLFLIGYAIVKRELFEIKVVLTALLVGLITVLLFLDAVIFTQEFSLQIFKGIILVIFLFFGYSLIKSVLREIKRREETERLSKAKSEFISIASHQLRTPLTAIKGYISMILEGDYGKMPEKAVKSMENVYRSNERLIKLVNDLLSVSRIEAGKMEIKFEKTALENVISNIVEELKIQAKKKNIYLKWEKPGKPLPKISLDREKIRQVFSNVMDNGIRYTEKGGVTINLESKNSNLKVTIKDTGEGMTQEEISKMFDSFSRGMAGSQLFTEGAGLGLYIAKKYIELHQGKIWAESPGKGKGSTFFIELPIK